MTGTGSASVVIIGAGHAGVECAWALRAAGVTRTIVLLGDEGLLPYQRPPLSKAVLAGTTSPQRLALRAETAYADLGIDVRFDDAAVALDTAARRVRLRSGAEVAYEACVLATGARARRLAGLFEDAHAIRTLADAMALRQAMQPGRRLLVVGGGYLGLEVASTASGHGCHVVVVENAPALLAGRLSSAMSAQLLELHSAAGVRVHLGTEVRSAARHPSGWCVVLSDGSVHGVDDVLVAVGAWPNVELARAANLHCMDGVVVDAACRTSCEGVYAIGDCASAPRAELGRAVRIESVYNALAQARAAAARIAGTPAPAPKPPTFWSEQHGKRLQIAGLAGPASVDHESITPTARGCVVERYCAGALAVVEALDSPAEFMKATQRIRLRTDATA